VEQTVETEMFEKAINAKEAAAIIGCHEKTLIKLARQTPGFPAYKIGKVWRFVASSLVEWRTQQLSSSHHQHPSGEAA
jgi:predicted DNA-binding transcriptional regulator AlpA